MIKVLMVEDSPSVRMLMKHILESDPQIRVVGTADCGQAAFRFLETNKDNVDVVTMDIVMPGMDGIKATRHIMETTPLPIVVVSAAYKPEEAASSFNLMEAGAVAIIEKPVSLTHPDYPRLSQELVQTVKTMSEVKVVIRRPFKKTHPPKPAVFSSIPRSRLAERQLQLLVMGASTGGPPVLKTILSGLGRNFPLPILIVQHIGSGFVPGLVRWLQHETGMTVRIPAAGERYRPGHVYLAPDDQHMGVAPDQRIDLTESTPENGQRPSISYLFRSAARYYPKNTVGVLLTGMGTDGARELKMLKDSGAVTFAQDEKSCVVFGMPGDAVKLDGAHFVLPPAQIAEKILEMLQTRRVFL